MPFKRSAMRYGHIAGYTSAVYQENGERIISFGYDGDVRVWDGVFDDDASTTCLAENVWALLQYGDRVLVANDLNTVQAYKYPELEKDGIEFRFTAFVTSLVRNGQYLAAGSEDGTIKVKPTGTEGDEFELGGLAGPVLSMALSPKNLLAASCGDGKLRVWDLTSKKLLKTLDGLKKVKSFEGNVYFATPSFDPKRGSVLAFPRGKEIVVLNTTTWDQQKLLKHKSLSAEFTCGAFSPRGEFFAAGSAKGEVVIWDYQTGELVKGEEVSIDSNPLISLTWHPKNNGELVICDDQGQLGNVNDIFNDTDDADDGNDLMEMAEKEANGADEEDDDDDLDEMYSKHVAGTKQVAEESDDDDNTVSVNRLKSQFALPTEDEDDQPEPEVGKPEDDKSDDENPEDEKPQQVKAASTRIDYDDDDDARSVMSDTSVKSYPMQRYFQPGSTPEKLAHRYLVYNHVGIVRGHTDGNEKAIEVEFHDSSKHHGMHLANFQNHTVAGLSETVLAMGCSTGTDCNSKLVCINLVAFGNREWSSIMPDMEEIVGVVASDKTVVAATTAGLLRVYSAKGTQREVIAIPGPLVSMAAYGDHVLVAYHRSPATRDQHLNLMIITCVNYRLRCREVSIPLTPESELRWLGYSDKGSPVIYDSAGSMRLYHAASNLWFPIMDAEKHKIGASDCLFIVTVSESRQQAQIIVCRGAKFPQTNPRPIPLNVAIQVPLCEIDSEKSVLEESLLRSMYLKHDDADKVMKEAAVKLFALASRAEMEPRAKELIETIASSQLIPLVCKYARKINRVHLAESLSALLGTFQDQVSLYAISLCKCCRSAHRSSLCCIGFDNVACDVAHACAIFRSRFRRFSPPKCDV
nr:WD repeat and HMG-box DNA-binding protein 1-like [Aedes albopictus]